METLASVLQSDIGQDMRVHNSTFLWFIPFVQSLMDLNDLGMAYIVEVIHHLHSQVKDVLNQTAVMCDKVTEFFLLILVSVIELHRSKKCLHLLWVSSQQWVEAIVKCAKLPTTAFARNSEKSSASSSKGPAVITSLSLHSVPSNSVQLACVQLIRSLLKEGYQLGQQTLCKRFWDKLNLFLRGNLSLGWQLTSQETHELQTCLKQIIRNIRLKMPQYTALAELAPPCKMSAASNGKEESEQIEKACEKDIPCPESCSPTCSKEPMKADVCQEQERSAVSKASNTIEEEGNEHNSIKDLKLEDHLSAESHLKESSKSLPTERAQDQVKKSTKKQKSVKNNSSCTPQNLTSRNDPEEGCDRGVTTSAHLLADPNTDSLEKAPTSKEDFTLKNDDVGKTSKAKTKAQKNDICTKLSHVIKKQSRKRAVVKNTVDVEGDVTVSDRKNSCSKTDTAGQKGDGFIPNFTLDPKDVLDHKNEGQKSHNSLLLKQLKKEKLDVPSFHENGCQIQECHVDNKDFISFTLLPKVSLCKVPMTLLGSRDKEINKSTDRVSCDLRDQAPSSPQCDTLTDSQIDRDLHKLSLIAQASVSKFPSVSTQNSSCQFQRKGKDKRSFRANQNNVRETCSGQVIIISDSDEDGDEPVPDVEKRVKQDKARTEKERPGPGTSLANVDVDMKPAKEEKTEEFEDCGSQVFEFESQQEVFSVWQDQKRDNRNSVQEDEKNPCLTYIADITNEWGYDTDYPMSEEVTKNEAEGSKHAKPPSDSSVEIGESKVKKSKRKKQLKKTTAEDSSKPSSSVRNKDQSDTLNERDLTENDTKIADIRTSPDSGVERATSPKKSSPKHRTSKADRRSSVSKTPKKTHSDTKKGQNKASNYISCRSTPAIVLPKKSRHCPEPTSVAEKLGLKKAPRRAVELSQRSLDMIGELRNHGKTVGKIGTPKKAKLISPQNLPGNDKKLLVSQDLQYQRQRRSKSHRNRQGLCDSADTTRAGPHGAQNSDSVIPDVDRSDDSNRGGAEVMAHSSGNQSATCVCLEQGPGKEKYVCQVAGDTCLLRPCSSPVLNGRIPTSETTVCTTEDPFGGGTLTGHRSEGPTWKRGQLDSDSDMEGDDIFLTQHDPKDMDLCSQMQNGDRLIEEVHRKSVQVEDPVSRPQAESLSSARCKYKDCVETVKGQGEYCSKHSEAKAADEDVFRKPALPPPASKPLRPSTTKIFSSSSTSRIANFSKSLESSSVPPGLKNKSNGGQPASKVPQPASLLSPKPRAELKSLYNIFNSPTPSNSSRQAFKFPFAESRPFTSSPINILLSSQSISDTFVKEVLKWKYEMFVKFDQCGPPASLCQAISRPVPVRFQDCGDYFNVFFPLVLLNAFETVSMHFNCTIQAFFFF